MLGYEIALMRSLSVARWHHLAYMVISFALLGFGASGTLLSLWGKRLLRRFEASMACLATAFAVAIPVSFSLAQRVPFDIFQLSWDWRQCVYLFEYYLLLFVPFLLGAMCVGLAFVREARHVHRLYFWNLLGSGVGSCGMVGLMFLLFPAQLPLGALVAASLGVLVYATRQRRVIAIAGLMAFVLLYFTLIDPTELNISQYKSLCGHIDRGARVIAARTSPLGTVHVLDDPEEPTIRLVTGRSLNYLGDEPRQRALLVDADSPSAIVHLASREQAANYDYTTSALAYHLLDRPRTLIIGAGGGSDVVLARYRKARSVTALEINPVVVDFMRGSQAEFAQHIYDQPGVELVTAEARGFLAGTQERYDLIQLPLVGSFGAASAGVYALNESYLYTVEALNSYLDHLTDHGILSITRWRKDTLPSDPIRVFATLSETLRRRGIRDVGSYLVFIRGGWSTATILASPRPFAAEQIASVRSFCDERGFDLVWLQGMDPSEANQQHRLAEPIYAEAAHRLLSDERESFLRAYLLDITPTTDDRPYHALSVRWRALRHLLGDPSRARLSMVEWGYILLIATLAQAAVAGAVLILLPLFFLRRQRERRGGRLATCIYFACLGVAYMFVEIVMMQKLTLFLASPIYAAAAVLASFMVFSGLGSLVAGRLLDHERRAATFGIAGTVAVGLALWAGMDGLLAWLWGSPGGLRVVVAVSCAGSLAFFMGMPFPSGLRRVANQVPTLTPWAWGVNGCASVVGVVLAMVLAVSLGFRAVLLVAFAAYAIAAVVLPQVRSRERAT